MHWLVLYGFARALYESKAFTIHAGFHGSGCIGHCMSPKPSLYMQGSMALASPGVARTLY